MIYLFFTGGSGNRGCEAIVRGTCSVLEDYREELIAYTAHLDEEKAVKLTKAVRCRPLGGKEKGIIRFISHLEDYMSYHFGNGAMQVRNIYSDFFKAVRPGDIYLVIGGDVYCYGKPYIYYRTNEILKENRKILWGCSIEPSSIDFEMKKDLRGYDLIYARESITYDALIQAGLQKVCLCPDPAFAMKARKCALPKEFEIGNVIGINASPLIIEHENSRGITMENYCGLAEYILGNTDCKIALIPHVIWKGSDDRTVLDQIYDKYRDTGRVFKIDALSAQKIKYVISKCCFLVTARTHASIAAYSTCVPTLVVGYSVKARGLAKDIFGDIDHYTIPVQKLKRKEDLTEAFRYLWNQREDIHKHLVEFMPSYISELQKVKDRIKPLFPQKRTVQ